MSSRRFGVPIAAVCVIGSAGIVASLAAPASAAPHAAKAVQTAKAKQVLLNVDYNAKGTSTVAKTNSTVTLGPATLKTQVTPQGKFTGTLPLPPTTTSFKVENLLPASATVTFVPSGKVTGALITKGDKSTITSTSKFFLKLSNVTVAGLPAMVGSTCETTAPVVINAATPKGKSFNIEKGGVITSTYTIGDFANCGLTTSLINQLVPGAGNTLSLNLTDGHVVY